jgi:hypothetical protein
MWLLNDELDAAIIAEPPFTIPKTCGCTSCVKSLWAPASMPLQPPHRHPNFVEPLATTGPNEWLSKFPRGGRFKNLAVS